MTRIYLAGKMSGLPEFNYPAFRAEAARLRALGYEVSNPADNPEPACGTWLGYMRAAITQLATCDAVALLDGWQDSRGANVERDLARGMGLPVHRAADLVEVHDVP
jgi:hypothetical protein